MVRAHGNGRITEGLRARLAARRAPRRSRSAPSSRPGGNGATLRRWGWPAAMLEATATALGGGVLILDASFKSNRSFRFVSENKAHVLDENAPNHVCFCAKTIRRNENQPK